MKAIGVGLVLLPEDILAAAARAALSQLGIALSIAGSVLMTPLTLANGGFEPIVRAPGEMQLLPLGTGCTAVNFALWYYGLKHTSAAAASAFQYMILPTSVAIAAFFLGEPISPTLGLGTLCILIGLVTTQIASARRGAGVSVLTR